MSTLTNTNHLSSDTTIASTMENSCVWVKSSTDFVYMLLDLYWAIGVAARNSWLSRLLTVLSTNMNHLSSNTVNASTMGNSKLSEEFNRLFCMCFLTWTEHQGCARNSWLSRQLRVLSSNMNHLSSNTVNASTMGNSNLSEEFNGFFTCCLTWTEQSGLLREIADWVDCWKYFLPTLVQRHGKWLYHGKQLRLSEKFNRFCLHFLTWTEQTIESTHQQHRPLFQRHNNRPQHAKHLCLRKEVNRLWLCASWHGLRNQGCDNK